MYDNIPIEPGDIVFLGDSLTEGFNLRKYFGRDDLRNRGISGSTTDQILYRLEGIIKGKPHKVLLMAGVNDLFQGSDPHEITTNIHKIADQLVAGTPSTKIYIMSVLPVNEQKLLIESNINMLVYELNDLIRKLCKKLDMGFIDLHRDFINSTGQLDSIYTFDGVHLNEKAYHHWAQLIESFLN
ncbi:MAG: G-D-S-L family lipolytic protein [Bacteroidetes bacterium]|nr:G-D-S-L family lipolytic protein [Bacteroidota bacterium]